MCILYVIAVVGVSECVVPLFDCARRIHSVQYNFDVTK